MASRHQGGLTLSVPQAVWINASDGLAGLKHETVYTIRFENKNNHNYDVSVWVDGKEVGTFRVPANRSIELKRSSQDSREFVFVRETSNEAKDGMVAVGAEMNGAIKAIWKPEKPPAVVYRGGGSSMGATRGGVAKGAGFGSSAPKYRSVSERDLYDLVESFCNHPDSHIMTGIASSFSRGMSSGATVLGSDSGQTFSTASRIEYDTPDKFITMCMRLACIDDDEPRKKYAPLPDVSVLAPRVD